MPQVSNAFLQLPNNIFVIYRYMKLRSQGVRGLAITPRRSLNSNQVNICYALSLAANS